MPLALVTVACGEVAEQPPAQETTPTTEDSHAIAGMGKYCGNLLGVLLTANIDGMRVRQLDLDELLLPFASRVGIRADAATLRQALTTYYADAAGDDPTRKAGLASLDPRAAAAAKRLDAWSKKHCRAP